MHSRRGLTASILLLGILGGMLLWPCLSPGQQVVRNGFEGLKPVWEKGAADAPYEEKIHAITDLAFHDGKRSEYLQLEAKQGSFIYYQYPVGRAPIGEELAVGTWLKADRPGIQILARVVLPNERDPGNLGNLVTTYLRGDTYQTAGQWKRLAIGRPVKLALEQQQLMRAKLKRSLDFTGAYIDMLLLNVYAGPGPTQVWIDDLEVGPVLADTNAQPAVRSGTNDPAKFASIRRPAKETLLTEFRNNQIVIANKRVLFRAIRFTDTLLRPLRDARFNTILFESNVSEATLREAAELELWVAPQLALAADNGQPIPPEDLTRQLDRYAGNSVLFVRFPGMLSFEQAGLVGKAAQALRAADPNRLIAADVWDGLAPYSRSLDLVGVHRWPLMTGMELAQYREWLEQRRNLANPGVFTWTWIQTHLPEWFSQILYEHSASTPFAEPVGPQPEQIRLLTYTALATGCRGLAFYSDRFLADSHQGRDRLLACALLNHEMEMLEPLLVSVKDPPEWIETSAPEVKAAVLRCPGQGVLVLPMWQGDFSQFVPGQAAATNVSITVPQVPQSAQAWAISPADVHHLKPERVWPGLKVTLKEFGLTAAILFTSDTALIGRLQDQVRARRQIVAERSYELAEYELEKVARIQEQLATLGKGLPEAPILLQDARKRLKHAKELWENRVFAEAYSEAQRALRPLRLLMRAQWEKAVRGLDSPVAIPYAVSYYTLPRHWPMLDLVRSSVAGENLLPSGDFEDVPGRKQESWLVDDKAPLDDVELIFDRVGQLAPPKEFAKDDNLKFSPYAFSAGPVEKKKCIMLQIRPRGLKLPPQALDRTHLAVTSPAVHLQPGTLVQISAYIDLPTTIKASADGALFYDNAGGEPLAIRVTQAMGWKKFTLYRRVPSNGIIQVTLALTGLGTVLFDDIRVEPLYPENSPAGQQARAVREAKKLADERLQKEKQAKETKK
jgi:hypothetical protein